MNFKMIHENYNVYDLDRSIAFYKKALGLSETRRKESEDGSFIIVYMGSESSDFELELTWMRDMDRPYNLGDANSIWLLKRMILRLPTSSIRKWNAFVLKIPKWAFILSKIRTATGWKSFRRKNSLIVQKKHFSA